MEHIKIVSTKSVQVEKPYIEIEVLHRGYRYNIVFKFIYNPYSVTACMYALHKGVQTNKYYRDIESGLDFDLQIKQGVFDEEILKIIKEVKHNEGIREYYKSKDIPKTGVLITSILVTTDFYRSLKANSYQPMAKGANPLIDLQIDSIMGIQVYIDDDYCKKHNTEVVYITKPILSKEEFKAIIARLDNLISK